MAEIRVSGVIRGRVEEVWLVVGDFGAIADWAPALAKSELAPGATGRQVGDGRTCTIDGGPSFAEVQLARSDEDYTYTYDIPESPLPCTNYQSTIALRAQGDQTLIEWTSQFDPEPGQEQELQGMLKSIYQAGIDQVAQRFAG